MRVTIRDSERANLLCFFLHDLLIQKLSTKSGENAAAKLSGTMVFFAGGMTSAVVFNPAEIEITSQIPERIKAQIQGDLSALLDVALGGRYLKYLLGRKIKIAGNIRFLLKILQLFKGK